MQTTTTATTTTTLISAREKKKRTFAAPGRAERERPRPALRRRRDGMAGSVSSAGIILLQPRLREFVRLRPTSAVG